MTTEDEVATLKANISSLNEALRTQQLRIGELMSLLHDRDIRIKTYEDIINQFKR